jgi:hypothetical protein
MSTAVNNGSRNPFYAPAFGSSVGPFDACVPIFRVDCRVATSAIEKMLQSRESPAHPIGEALDLLCRVIGVRVKDFERLLEAGRVAVEQMRQRSTLELGRRQRQNE